MQNAFARFIGKIQVLILRLILKLPDSWKVKMAGGKPLTLGGRTLDPDFQFILHSVAKQPSFASMPAEEAQARAAASVEVFAAKPKPGVTHSDFTIASRGDHQIPVRLYTPDQQDPSAPMMAYWHQGGGVIGNIGFSDSFCRLIARTVKCPVLSVDYRLAPQHKFPAGLEDCLDAYHWVLDNAAKHGAPAGRITIGGDSMGGNFSAIIAQEARRNNFTMPELQLLIYPATDIVSEFESYDTYGDIDPLTLETMNWFMDQYLPAGHDRSDVRLCPGLEQDLTGLPPAIIATAGFDPLVDDSAAYARKLKAAGVETTHKCYDSTAHGFTAFMDIIPAARAACEEIAGMVRDAYAKF